MYQNKLETDLHQYVQLRTMLDSVERGTLRRYLNAPSQAERDEIFNYLKTSLMPIHDYVWGSSMDIRCPPGTNDCGGYCVDYPCVY